MALSLPVLATNADFGAVADWLAQASSAIVEEGNSALSTLQDLVDVDFSSVGTTPLYNGTQWYTFAAGIGNAPAAPTLAEVPLIDIINQIKLLTPPNAPTVSFNYVEPGYTGVLMSTIQDKLLYDLINGGYGIDINDEQALFDRTRDREAQLLSENEMNVMRQNAATGFPLPQGILSKQLDRARSAYVSKLSDTNRDITLERARLYVENRARTIDQALRSEEQHYALYNAIQNRLLLAARTEVEMAVFLYDAAVRLFTSKLEALKAQADTYLSVNQALAVIHSAEVNAFVAKTNAIIQSARIDMENSRNAAEHARNIWASQVQVTRDKLSQLVATTDNRRDIAKWLSDFFRTGLGSAMNGINGLAVNTAEVDAT